MPAVKKSVKPVKKATKKSPVKKTEPEKEKGIGQRKEATLLALKTLGGKKVSHMDIAKKTKKPKGNQLRELTELGYVTTIVEEGVRGHLFSLTPEGRKVANKL